MNPLLFHQLLSLSLLCFQPNSFDSHVAHSKSESLDIAALCKRGIVKIELTSLGSYQGECVEMKLKNTTNDSLIFDLEAGRKFIASDSSAQDILIVKSMHFKLAPRAEKNVFAIGYCCRATRHAPHKGMTFSLGELMPTEWIRVANYISNNSIPSHAIQSAVWALSDDHAVAAIQDDKNQSADQLRRLVANVKGVELPWYSVSYESDTSNLFSGKPQRVWGTVDYYIPNHAMISMVIHDKQGKTQKILAQNSAGSPGTYTYYFDLNVVHWKRGDYDFCIFEDGLNLRLKKKFSI